MYRLFRAPRGLRGKLFKLTGPIFLETLLMLTLGVVDTLMLSHHSDNAVAAVGVVNQLLNIFPLKKCFKKRKLHNKGYF